MTQTSTRRAVWTLEQWTEFGRRGRQARRNLRQVAAIANGTKGLRAYHVDSWLKAENQLHKAMVGAENAMARQHPEHEPIVMDVIHGDGSHLTGIKPPPRMPGRGMARPVATRDEWSEAGRLAKEARQIVMTMGTEFYPIAFATPAYRARFDRALRAIDLMKSQLDGLACYQHPEWPEVISVFY